MKEITTFIFYIKLDDDLFIRGFSGRIVHGAFLQFLRNYDEDLTNEVHSDNNRRPYRTTPLYFDTRSDNRLAHFEIRTFDKNMVETLVKIIISDQGKEIFLIDRFCPIVKIEYKRSLHPKTENFANGSSFRLRFKSPTIFANDNRKAKTDPYPHLDVIWKHLIHNYSRIIEEMDQEKQTILLNKLLNQLSTPHFELKSKHITLGHKIKVTGFVGTILFIVENNQDLELLVPILELAQVWGIGGKTTMGFGNLQVSIKKPKQVESNKTLTKYNKDKMSLDHQVN